MLNKIIFLGKKLILVLFHRKVNKFLKGPVIFLLVKSNNNCINLLRINNLTKRINLIIILIAILLKKIVGHKKLISKK